MLLSRKLIDPRRLAAMALIGLVSQSALSGESPEGNSKSAVEAAPISAEQIAAEARAFIETVDRRLAEELAAETLKDSDAARIELVSVETGPRG
jgi:hypothetical protein